MTATVLHPDDQRSFDTQDRHVVGVDPSDSTTPTTGTQASPADAVTFCPDDQSIHDTHSGSVVGAPSSNQPPTTHRTTPTDVTSGGWLELRIWAEMFDDAQKARIANTNRAERGGCDPDIYTAHLEALQRTEHECRKAMVRTLRRAAPRNVIAWQKASIGIGEPLLARLLGHLGHPRWATPHHWEGTGASRVLITDPPFERTIGQLWQFCGHGSPTIRRKGMSADELAANGSPTLKMIVHLTAECCMKQSRSPYRLVYEKARIDTAEKEHTVECVRCGPSGKPAQPGSPWSAGHQNAHALRITGKEILRDLWQVSG